jgi:coenzyme F420-0:L-glutamate ligase/coenzyme F420-1:gamma-L-glutamate ligase
MISIFEAGVFPEIQPGDDLCLLIGDALDGVLEDGDILAVTSKIVSKAEGRQIPAVDREAAITAETVRVVATRRHAQGTTRIVQNKLGLVMAAAGVDSSNTPEGTALLLPLDPDGSARELCRELRERFGLRIGVIITDTFGRPWREGQTDACIGAGGIRVTDDLRGLPDTQGRRMDVTVTALVDEIASAADLVKGKTSGMPVAVVRGLSQLVGDLTEPGAESLIRPVAQDLFSRGTEEAWEEGYITGLASKAIEEGLPGDVDHIRDGWSVVIPVKGTDEAKSRMTGDLTQRQAIALAIAIDTVMAAKAAPNVGRVLVVTSQQAAHVFSQRGVSVVVQEDGRDDGLNAAVRLGVQTIARDSYDSIPPRGIAVLLGDLPALQPSELAIALDAASKHCRAMVPDADGMGTVLLAAAPCCAHLPAFGAGSRLSHMDRGYIELALPATLGLRRDVDTFEHLLDCERLGFETRMVMEHQSIARSSNRSTSRLSPQR